AAGESNWRMTAYFLTLIAGGIALFIPGPWLVSYVFHYDFTTSFLIFTALVNIHHFLLDGAIWKLRDSRVASRLISTAETAPAAQPVAGPLTVGQATRSKSAPSTRPGFVYRVLSAPAFRVAVVGLLFFWGAADQVHFALGTNVQNL